jgi:colicin import membrane protein
MWSGLNLGSLVDTVNKLKDGLESQMESAIAGTEEADGQQYVSADVDDGYGFEMDRGGSQSGSSATTPTAAAAVAAFRTPLQAADSPAASPQWQCPGCQRLMPVYNRELHQARCSDYAVLKQLEHREQREQSRTAAAAADDAKQNDTAAAAAADTTAADTGSGTTASATATTADDDAADTVQASEAAPVQHSDSAEQQLTSAVPATAPESVQQLQQVDAEAGADVQSDHSTSSITDSSTDRTTEPASAAAETKTVQHLQAELASAREALTERERQLESAMAALQDMNTAAATASASNVAATSSSGGASPAEVSRLTKQLKALEVQRAEQDRILAAYAEVR